MSGMVPLDVWLVFALPALLFGLLAGLEELANWWWGE